MSEPIVITYLVYLALSIALTVWVARTLHKNGRVFLVDSFRGNETLADSVNHLLVVGFYLVNLGFVSLALKLGYEVASARESIEALSRRLGIVLVVLGIMHFFNIAVFSFARHVALRPHRGEPGLPPPSPVSPTWLDSAPGNPAGA